MTKKRTIAIDGRSLGSSSGRYVEGLLDHLGQATASQNFQYLVLLPAAQKKYYQSRWPQFDLKTSNFKDFSLGSQIGLAWQLWRLKPDLVHFCFPQHPVFYRAAFLTTIHDLTMLHFGPQNCLAKTKRIIFKKVIARAIRRGRFFISPSYYSQEQISRHFKVAKKKSRVVYLAAEPLSPQETSVKELESLDFWLTVNNGLEHKNNLGLAKAQQILLKNYPKLKLVIVGRLTKETKLAGHQPGVLALGRLTDSQLATVYKKAKLVAQGSFSEGFGLPGLRLGATKNLWFQPTLAACQKFMGQRLTILTQKTPKTLLKKSKLLLKTKS